MLRVFRKAKRTMSDYQWGRYKELKREYKEKLEAAENKYYKEKNESLTSSSTRNSKSWWETVNNILGRQKSDSYPPILDESNNKFVSEHAQKARLFNQFFLSHNQVDSSNVNIPVNEINENIPTLDNIITSEQEVLDYIVNIDANKATGHDGISPRLLKIADYSVVPSLTKLINMSLQQNIVPDIWKKANVIPVHKKNNESILNNYRPISILPAVSKILERIIFKHLYNFFHENNLLTNNQSGFKQRDYTINQLAYLYHTFCEALDKKKDVRIVFCDVSKAFDRVWHI